MELLFLTLNARRIEDQQAIERIMASRDKGWLMGLGFKGPRTPHLSRSTKYDENDAKQVDPNSEMAALEEKMVGMAINTRMENERPTSLTMRLIRANVALSKNTKRRARARSSEAEDTKIDAMLRKKVLRIDWLDIGKIENLDAFTHVEELYLQYNLIETIEGLDDHAQLTFLALAGNRIREVKNLKNLSNLKFLDLSMNYIDKFDVSEFPQSLCVLRVAGNPFVETTPAYAHFAFEKLPNLVEVDQFRRPSSIFAPKTTPLSAQLSKTVSETSALDIRAAVLPIPRSSMDQYRALQVEVELPHSEQDLLEKQEAEHTAVFNRIDCEKKRNKRVPKWKVQLTAIASTNTRTISRAWGMDPDWDE
ncbi:unnamed protein product [Peronospora farinosa]|uniref:Uncharacterized protein n=1 Tax=Peronospora farinosa TaxID=134698 RepID=A0AAV0TTM0_9STRA|nr:unnamed protein product [Peronospora farinosa]CAI5726886.1 unnamed protein product [Peronospora farinosa]